MYSYLEFIYIYIYIHIYDLWKDNKLIFLLGGMNTPVNAPLKWIHLVLADVNRTYSLNFMNKYSYFSNKY